MTPYELGYNRTMKTAGLWPTSPLSVIFDGAIGSAIGRGQRDDAGGSVGGIAGGIAGGYAALPLEKQVFKATKGMRHNLPGIIASSLLSAAPGSLGVAAGSAGGGILGSEIYNKF